MTSFDAVPYFKRSSKSEPVKSKNVTDKDDGEIYILQMKRILISTVEAMIRAFDDEDYGSLAQAGNNSQIVEEIFLQCQNQLDYNGQERTIFELSRTLKTISDHIIKAKTEDPLFKNSVRRIGPYFTLIMDDICPPKMFLGQNKGKGPSKKLLPSIEEDILSIMSNSTSQSTIRSGIYMYQTVEDLKHALSLSYHLLSFQ